MLAASRIAAGSTLLLVLALIPMVAEGQASPAVPLDDPLLPLFEHLVDRGVVRDPTPSVRPLRRADAVAALRAASNGPDSTLVDRLIRAWSPADPGTSWELNVRAGIDGFTSPRRDLMRTVDPSGTRVLGDVQAYAILGPVVLATRPTIEQRIAIDPDWTGNRVDASATCCRWHFPEAYISYQQGFLRVHLGQIARNWGPVGVDGIAMSNVAYARDDFAFEVLSRDLHLVSTVGFLRDTSDVEGTTIRRYQVASRLGIRIGDRLRGAVWQTAVLEGPSRDVEGPFRNPMVLLPLVNQFGMGDRNNNVMVGAEVGWRAPNGIDLGAELAIDDIVQRNNDQFPNRWAMTLRAAGPGPGRSSWRAWYTRASSLAFRATDPMESFTERGVGLGRGWADGDRIEVRLAHPMADQWLAAVALSGFRHGESELDQPIDVDAALEKWPTGTIERTLRAALQLSGRTGPLEARGDIGINQVTNPAHQGGESRTGVEARVTFQLRLGTQGRLN